MRAVTPDHISSLVSALRRAELDWDYQGNYWERLGRAQAAVAEAVANLGEGPFGAFFVAVRPARWGQTLKTLSESGRPVISVVVLKNGMLGQWEAQSIESGEALYRAGRGPEFFPEWMISPAGQGE